jgi:hypothetical protein
MGFGCVISLIPAAVDSKLFLHLGGKRPALPIR